MYIKRWYDYVTAFTTILMWLGYIWESWCEYMLTRLNLKYDVISNVLRLLIRQQSIVFTKNHYSKLHTDASRSKCFILLIYCLWSVHKVLDFFQNIDGCWRVSAYSIQTLKIVNCFRSMKSRISNHQSKEQECYVVALLNRY